MKWKALTSHSTPYTLTSSVCAEPKNRALPKACNQPPSVVDFCSMYTNARIRFQFRHCLVKACWSHSHDSYHSASRPKLRHRSLAFPLFPILKVEVALYLMQAHSGNSASLSALPDITQGWQTRSTEFVKKLSLGLYLGLKNLILD